MGLSNSWIFRSDLIKYVILNRTFSFFTGWAASTFEREREGKIIDNFLQQGRFSFTVSLRWPVPNEWLVTDYKNTCKPHIQLPFRFKGYLNMNRCPYSAQEKRWNQLHYRATAGILPWSNLYWGQFLDLPIIICFKLFPF